MVLLCLCGGMKTEFLEIYNEVTVVHVHVGSWTASKNFKLSKLLFILKYVLYGSGVLIFSPFLNKGMTAKKKFF